MFIFGHLGIGSKLIYRARHELPRTALLFGTVLPDLLDKPLYYGLVAAIGSQAASQSLISGTRTFGHTLLLLTIVILIGWLRKSRLMVALAAGMATHLLLDAIGDQIQPRLGFIHPGPGPSGLHAVLWPLLGWRFPIATTSLLGHAAHIIDPWILGGEIIGVSILVRDYQSSS